MGWVANVGSFWGLSERGFVFGLDGLADGRFDRVGERLTDVQMKERMGKTKV